MKYTYVMFASLQKSFSSQKPLGPEKRSLSISIGSEPFSERIWKKKGLTWNNSLGHRFDHIFGGISCISGIYGINGTTHNAHKKQKALNI